jgi:secretion/DNA translocation related TadE-like protein
VSRFRCARGPHEPGPRDGGYATVWAVGGITVIMALVVFAVQLGTAIATRHRAEAAADLAALAAAQHAVRGQQVACARAGQIATAMGGVLAECGLLGWEALVTVRVAAPFTLLTAGEAAGSARAGPAVESP